MSDARDAREQLRDRIAEKIDSCGAIYKSDADWAAELVMELFVEVREDATLRPGYVIAEVAGADWGTS